MRKLFIAAALACAFASPANAATLLFTLSGTDSVSFTLDSHAVPGGFVTTPYQAGIYAGVSLTYNGTAGVGRFIIFPQADGGGFELQIPNANPSIPQAYISPMGAVIFSGTLQNPVFSPGTFAFKQDFLRGAINNTLVISDPSVIPGGPTGGVPEPATWAMMIAGFGLIGTAFRRRRPSVTVSFG